MGNSCGCDINEKNNEFLSFELSNKPVEKTIIGSAIYEESFIVSNINLHISNFSRIIFNQKGNERSNSIKSNLKSRKRNGSNQISLFRSVQEYSKVEDNEGSIIYEGELLKYRPGISKDYTPRWCRLTLEGFAYYKTQWAATCSNKIPLAFIPLMQIKEVNIINRTGKRDQSLYEFEINLYEEDDLTKLSKTTNGFTVRVNLDCKEIVPSTWWSVRQAEWYSAERRLLFASTTDIIHKWVQILRKTYQCVNV